MRRRAIVPLLSLSLLGGCGAFSTWTISSAPAPAVPTPPPAVVAAEPPPKAPAPVAPVVVPNGDRAKRIDAARADLKTALTQMELRAVTACDKGRLAGEGCPEIQQMIDRARATDERLVKALLNPKMEIDWADVTKLLRLLVEQSKEVKP